MMKKRMPMFGIHLKQIEVQTIEEYCILKIDQNKKGQLVQYLNVYQWEVYRWLTEIRKYQTNECMLFFIINVAKIYSRYMIFLNTKRP